MRSPFRKGWRVCIANDVMLLYGYVINPEFYIGNGGWGVCIWLPSQPDLEHLVRDITNFRCEIDVAHRHGIFKGYAVYRNDELFVVPDH